MYLHIVAFVEHQGLVPFRHGLCIAFTKCIWADPETILKIVPIFHVTKYM